MFSSRPSEWSRTRPVLTDTIQLPDDSAITTFGAGGQPRERRDAPAAIFASMCSQDLTRARAQVGETLEQEDVGPEDGESVSQRMLGLARLTRGLDTATVGDQLGRGSEKQ